MFEGFEILPRAPKRAAGSLLVVHALLFEQPSLQQLRQVVYPLRQALVFAATASHRRFTLAATTVTGLAWCRVRRNWRLILLDGGRHAPALRHVSLLGRRGRDRHFGDQLDRGHDVTGLFLLDLGWIVVLRRAFRRRLSPALLVSLARDGEGTVLDFKQNGRKF
jgi:hypothetical protein